MTFESERNVLPATTENADGCEVLGKLQIHEIQQGQGARLDWQMRTGQGGELDLTDLVSGEASEVPYDSAGCVVNGVMLRVREASGFNPGCHKVHTVEVEITSTEQGLVRAAKLPKEIRNVPGLYEAEWAVVDNEGDVVTTNRSMIWVNSGLFGLNNTTEVSSIPSLEQIRLSLRDNSAADNSLLDAVEFDTAEIAQAVLRPVRYWNEVPPPLRPNLDTTNYPFQEHWLKAIQGNLFLTAAHHYRRNNLSYNAGGVAVADKDKEQEYLRMAQILLDDYKQFVSAKKLEINMAMCTGSVGSSYGRLFY